jgi:hypothetical protein
MGYSEMYSSTISTGRPADSHREGSQRWYQSASYSISGANAASRPNAHAAMPQRRNAASDGVMRALFQCWVTSRDRRHRAGNEPTARRATSVWTTRGRYSPNADSPRHTTDSAESPMKSSKSGSSKRRVRTPREPRSRCHPSVQPASPTAVHPTIPRRDRDNASRQYSAGKSSAGCRHATVSQLIEK